MVNINDLGQLFKATKREKDFTKIYNGSRGPLMSVLKREFPNQDWHDEIYNETMMKVWMKIDQFDPEKSFSTWLFAIAINCCRQRVWYDKREIRKIDRDAVNLPYTSNDDYIPAEGMRHLLEQNEFELQEEKKERELQVKEMYDEVMFEIEQMHPLYKPVFVDAIVNGMKHKDVAAKHNVKISTVKSRVHIGKNKIKERLQLSDI